MLLLLGVLIAAYFIVSANFASDSATDTTDTGASYVQVNGISQESIVGVSYTNDGVEYEFALSGGKWKYLADETFPVDAYEMSEITSALSGIRAERAINGDLHSADFGLDYPAHTVRVTLSAGGVLVYNIGAFNKHTDSYYMTAEGHSQIYMIKAAFGELFERDIYELVATETLPSIALSGVKKITADTPDGTVTLEKKSTDSSVAVWEHTNLLGAAAAMETADAEKAVSALISPSTAKCVHHDLPDDKLADYGMDESSRIKITVYYDTQVSANQSDGQSSTAGGSITVSREFVYYLGRVTVTADETDTSVDTLADSTADTTAETTAETAADTTADTTEDSTATSPEVQTYFMLDGSRMIYKVTLTAADALFE